MIQFLFRLIGLAFSIVFSIFAFLFILSIGLIFTMIWLLTGRKKMSNMGQQGFKFYKINLGDLKQGPFGQRKTQGFNDDENIRDAEVIDVQAIEIEHNTER